MLWHLLEVTSLIVHRLQGTLDDLAGLWTHDLKHVKVFPEICHFCLRDAPCLLRGIQCERQTDAEDLMHDLCNRRVNPNPNYPCTARPVIHVLPVLAPALAFGNFAPGDGWRSWL